MNVILIDEENSCHVCKYLSESYFCDMNKQQVKSPKLTTCKYWQLKEEKEE